MMRSLPWPKTAAILPFARPLLKGLAISSVVTLCFSLALSGLSKSTDLPSPTTPPKVRAIELATVEPNIQSEHKVVPVTPAQPAVTYVAKTTPEISLGTAERTTPAHSPVADIGVMHKGKSARRGVEIGYGLVAPPIGTRPAAQRITSNRSLDASFWQFAASAETAISELAPRRKSMSQAIDTLRQRIASVIDVLR